MHILKTRRILVSTNANNIYLNFNKMKHLENPYLQISQIVADTFDRLMLEHLEVIFAVKLVGKSKKEQAPIIEQCRKEWDALTWNEIMEHLNDIYN